MNPADYTIRKSVIAWVATVLVLVGGYMSYERLGRFEDPDFVIRQAVVVTSYPGASPAQVAEEITDLIEGAAQQMQEVESVTSVSRAGESLVKIEAPGSPSRATRPSSIKSGPSCAARSPTSRVPCRRARPSQWSRVTSAMCSRSSTPSPATATRRGSFTTTPTSCGGNWCWCPAWRGSHCWASAGRRCSWRSRGARAAQFGVPLDQVYATLRAQNVVSAGRRRARRCAAAADPARGHRGVGADTQEPGRGRRCHGGLVRLEDIADIRRE